MVLNTVRFVRRLRPRAVMLENVPWLGRDRRAATLVTTLNRLGYVCRQYHVDASDFAVPQRRKRLIILGAGRHRRLPDSLVGACLDGPKETVRTAFKQLAEVIGEGDPINVSRAMSPTVVRWVAAVPPGGTRFDLPPELQLPVTSSGQRRP